MGDAVGKEITEAYVDETMFGHECMTKEEYIKTLNEAHIKELKTYEQTIEKLKNENRELTKDFVELQKKHDILDEVYKETEKQRQAARRKLEKYYQLDRKCADLELEVDMLEDEVDRLRSKLNGIDL